MERPKMVKALKTLLHNADLKSIPFFTTINSQKIRIIVSLLRIDEKMAGWILTMEGTGEWAEQA
jgi:hypothetical protein